METRAVYLDHNATTPVHPEVIEAMLPFFQEYYGNPSSIHQFGRKVRVQMDEARESVAEIINAEASEIIFTSGGSESDNLAITGVALQEKNAQSTPCHIITSATEHSAVLETCHSLKRLGVDTTFLPVDSMGIISPDLVECAIQSNTILISIQHSNNETGVIQFIEQIGEIAQKKDILFHVDAVQSLGKVPVDVLSFHADMVSLSAHKLNGPKGVGALFLKKGVQGLHPLIHGGAQEKMRRAGTENIPGIIGFAKACSLAQKNSLEKIRRYESFRNTFEKELLRKVQNVTVHGKQTKRLPNTSNVSFHGVEGDALLISLDLAGIAVSYGSACSSGKVESSHVLKAMGIPKRDALGSLRFSFGHNNSDADINYVMDQLPIIVQRIRDISPHTP